VTVLSASEGAHYTTQFTGAHDRAHILMNCRLFIKS
jgi:hypothetical protein